MKWFAVRVSQDASFRPHGIKVSIDGVSQLTNETYLPTTKLISCVSPPWTAPSTGKHFGSARFVLEELFEPCRRSTCPTKTGVSQTAKVLGR